MANDIAEVTYNHCGDFNRSFTIHDAYKWVQLHFASGFVLESCRCWTEELQDVTKHDIMQQLDLAVIETSDKMAQLKKASGHIYSWIEIPTPVRQAQVEMAFYDAPWGMPTVAVVLYQERLFSLVQGYQGGPPDEINYVSEEITGTSFDLDWRGKMVRLNKEELSEEDRYAMANAIVALLTV